MFVRTFAASGLALLAALPLPALAQTAFDAEPVAESTLQIVAGREDLSQVAKADQDAVVTRNSIGDNSSTGEVRIADSAFQNLNGLSLLNINTGNNVAINASMNVNIAINPGP